MFLKKHTIHIFNGHPSCLRDNGLCCKNVFLTHKFDSYKKCAIIIFDFNLFSVRFLGINRRTNLVNCNMSNHFFFFFNVFTFF